MFMCELEQVLPRSYLMIIPGRAANENPTKALSATPHFWNHSIRTQVMRNRTAIDASRARKTPSIPFIRASEIHGTED